MKVHFALFVKPADEGSFRAYCQRQKLSLPKKTLLQQYCILHSKYFSCIVERGQYIDYHSNELVPYQQIYVDGFPKTDSFERVDKAYAPSQPHTVLARKEIFANYDKSELDKRIQKEVETLKKLDHPHLLPDMAPSRIESSFELNCELESSLRVGSTRFVELTVELDLIEFEFRA